MTDEEKIKDYPAVREELKNAYDRLGEVYMIIRAAEDVGRNCKVTRLIREKAFPKPDIKEG